jgi:glycosyltransferase involved in cell wall biosynthesis
MVHVTRLHVFRRFDVIHVNNMPDFLVFAALPARLLGARVILDLHDPMPELFAAKMGGGWLVKIITLVERASIAFADRAIAVQQAHIDVFVGHGNRRDKFTEVQNTPDARIFPNGAALDLPRDSPILTLVYHGTMAPRLGIDTLIHAVEILRGREPSVQATLVGDGDDAARLEKLIADRGLSDVVHFSRGFVPVDALLPILLDADIGVVPAGLDAFTNTMLPSKLLEYVALGIPVVCADLPAVRRYFTDDQITFFAPSDPEALAAAVSELSSNTTRRRQQAELAMSFLDDHGWDAERSRYLALIDELTSQ